VHGDGSTDCYLEYDRASGYPARYAAQVDISGIAGLAGLDLPDGHRLLIANDGGYRFGSISGSVATSSTYTLRVVFQGSGGTAAVNGQQVAAFQPSAGAQRQMRLLVAPSSSGATFIGAYFAAFSFTPTA
jgi:hypothetical protein